jgi:hypothetical protein
MSYPGGFSTWTAQMVIGKARNITGTPSADQLSDSQMFGYLNQVYVYVMPPELKLQIENQFLTFKTTPGIDVYSFPSGYFTDQPGAYADGFPLIFYQDPDIFYQDWPEQYATDNIATGDGVTMSFSGGLQNPPTIVGTAFFSSVDANDVTYIAQDIGVTGSNVFPNGTLSAPAGSTYTINGTINYLTGAYTLEYSTAPSASAVLYARYQGYQPNRPQGVLFFNNQFTMRPVPAQVHQIKMQGYVIPKPLVLETDTPLQAEWGAYLAYAMSLEIFSDRGDMDNYDRYYPVLKRYENIALSRTIQQLTSEQSVGRF